MKSETSIEIFIRFFLWNRPFGTGQSLRLRLFIAKKFLETIKDVIKDFVHLIEGFFELKRRRYHLLVQTKFKYSQQLSLTDFFKSF